MKRIDLNKIRRISDALFDNASNEDREVDAIFTAINNVLCEMILAEDGDIHYSVGNFGVSITKDYIDFVDIESGTSLGTLVWG